MPFFCPQLMFEINIYRKNSPTAIGLFAFNQQNGYQKRVRNII